MARNEEVWALFFRPEGARQNSPGQRPGGIARFPASAALKGRYRRTRVSALRSELAARRRDVPSERGPILCRPFRAKWWRVATGSQGVALGFSVPPRWGDEGIRKRTSGAQLEILASCRVVVSASLPVPEAVPGPSEPLQPPPAFRPLPLPSALCPFALCPLPFALPALPHPPTPRDSRCSSTAASTS